MNGPLSHENYEQFVRLFTSCEGGVRAVLRSLVPSLDDLDEVMQETSLAAIRKFQEFEPGTNFFAWMVTIGRFEALRWRRARAAGRMLFNDRLCDLLADEAMAEANQREVQRQALATCLGKLRPRQRELLLAAYQSGLKLREVASRVGMSADAFYKMLQRIRIVLVECVQKGTGTGDQAFSGQLE